MNPTAGAGRTPRMIWIISSFFCDVPIVLKLNSDKYLFQFRTRIASIEPSCIITSNVFAFAPVNPNKCPTRIKCPVVDTGRYSVNPSTIPSIKAIEFFLHF